MFVVSLAHCIYVSLTHLYLLYRWLIRSSYLCIVGSLAHEKHSIISVNIHLLVVCVTHNGYLSSQLMWPCVAGCGRRPLACWRVSQYDIGSRVNSVSVELVLLPLAYNPCGIKIQENVFVPLITKNDPKCSYTLQKVIKRSKML